MSSCEMSLLAALSVFILISVHFLLFFFYNGLFLSCYSYFVLNGLERVVRLVILPKRNYVSEPFHLM